MTTSTVTLEALAARARAPRAADRVYRDECVLSFDSALSPAGLYTNLATFLSYGRPFRRFDRDALSSGHALYLHQRHTKALKTPPPTGDSDKQDAPTKLAIGGDGGFAVNAQDKLEVTKVHSIVVYDAQADKDVASFPLDAEQVPAKVKEVAKAVLNHAGSVVQEEVATWQEELKETKYADHLVQIENPPKISSNPAHWKCQAPTCDKQENLWLNLSDGFVGCGRKNWDGTGGCGAALDHYVDTGGIYPLAVKLGTITSEGGDVYSYTPDEDDMVSNKHLIKHLAHFGINVANLKKTDKSMNELQVGLNLSYEFDAITESGKKLQSVSGPGLIGFKNLGNSCYMNSVLQLLLALPEVQHRYGSAADSLYASISTSTIPPDDFAVQMAKLASGVLTDRYAKSFKKSDAGGQEDDEMHTQELRPITFRGLVGKNHSEFSTGQQQDAVEYLQYLLDVMTRQERANSERIWRLDPSVEATADMPTANLFKFKFEDRVECLTSHKVKYVSRDDTFLQVQIPLEAATNANQVKEYQASSDQKRQRLDGASDATGDKDEVAILPNVPFDASIEKTLAPELIEDFLSSATGKKGLAQKTVRFKTFPRYLLVQMRRFYVDEDWTPKKLDVIVPVPDQFSLGKFLSKGVTDGEELLPETEATGESTSNATSDAVTPDETLVAQLVSMGFSENGCKRAAIATGNANAEVAMEWIFSHMEDPDFNDPPAALTSASSSGNGSSAPANAELVSNLMAMGFSEVHVSCALKQTNNDPDRAAEWLFSHMDDLDAAVAMCESEITSDASGGETAKRLDDSSSKGDYSLVGFVSHVGKNTSSGHYVCHLKKNGRWVIFNDDKVALSEEPPFGSGYLYLFRRVE